MASVVAMSARAVATLPWGEVGRISAFLVEAVPPMLPRMLTMPFIPPMPLRTLAVPPSACTNFYKKDGTS